MSSKVYVRLPKAGLGNKLLTWSRALVFAKENGLELHTSSWITISFGVWLRRENRKRLYFGYFNQPSLYKQLRFLLYSLFYKREKEPGLRYIWGTDISRLYVFDKIFREFDFFKEVRTHRVLVKQSLLEMLTPSIRKAYEKYEKPVIGVHVRRGDFKIGSKITPLSFFIEVVNSIRSDVKQDLPVTVFTDADEDEIRPLLELKEVKLAEKKADILDILLLASSRVVVLSIGSTFSYWAGFLSDGIIIKHAEEWHSPFRLSSDPASKNEAKWKVRFKSENEQLNIV